MVRPRARRKTRNPGTKTTRKQKNRYDISFAGVHPLVQKHWDSKLTLKQNYERLGLLSSLNGTTGGAEMVPPCGSGSSTDTAPAIQATVVEEDDPSYTPLEGHLTLDPRPATIGTIISRRNDPGYAVVTTVASVDSEIPKATKKFGHVTVHPKDSLAAQLIAAFEKEAASAVRLERKTSEQEGKFMLDLVKKHGDDYAAMARDMKLNPYQLTEGQLRKRCERALKSRK
ncbi:ribosome biogenesis protein Nop16 [Polychytrium aggregatum]|uniref:ribosome biogenesis protein Nop16 n=1 Tax=Polychytrium aggregatum TaxID=110093 RepID=UPI0022FED6FF|nr:ribosome biogenesis protein Nop16 [Polychytrium aggregatum]KAI9206502.1 ribosome biogenesis protein Nop16 [Polychytrium aggregatum]